MFKAVLYLYFSTLIVLPSVWASDPWMEELNQKYPQYLKTINYFKDKACALSSKQYQLAESLDNIASLQLENAEVEISKKKYWSQIKNDFNTDEDILVFDIIAKDILYRLEIRSFVQGTFWLKLLDASTPYKYVGVNQLYRNCKTDGYSIFTPEDGLQLDQFSPQKFTEITKYPFANDWITLNNIERSHSMQIIAIVDTPVATSNSKIFPYLARKEDGTVRRIHLFGNPEKILEDGHGTSVAGIAHKRDPNIAILPVTASFHNYLLAGTGENFWPSQTKMFKKAQEEQNILQFKSVSKAVEYGAKVINMSFGVVYKDNAEFGFAHNTKYGPTGSIDGYRSAIKSNPGVVFVVAAGNDNNSLDHSPTVPAVDTVENENQITVGSYFQEENKYKLSKFSNFSSNFVDVLAPGDKVSTLGLNNSTDVSSGTSLAAPVVSHLVAKMFMLNSSLQSKDIKKIICRSATKIKSLRFASRCGILNESKAIKLATKFNH